MDRYDKKRMWQNIGPVMHKDAKYDLVPDYSLLYGNEEDPAVSAVCDGQWWVFLKINNDSEWSEHIYYSPRQLSGGGGFTYAHVPCCYDHVSQSGLG
ncbi:hypothetical protein N7530_012061 [Penicillium desertorum]|uniref:Uncharacterized protein n=1 Tax=Penicillium desertorum TaxID=1303715 RepID=A0A9W9WEX1_9EURO|nr:hypothetical protein N7530_012061 [Penicillium desertorum]